MTARRWTSEDLDAASHTPDLVQRDRIWVNLDHAQQGIGSDSCRACSRSTAWKRSPRPSR